MILIESNIENIDVLKEGTGDAGKKTYLRGVFMECEKRNRNNRVYRLDEMTREVERIDSLCRQGQNILGELDHPDGGGEVKLRNVSHKIVSMKMEGNAAIGKAEILEKTQAGSILLGLVESGVRVGVSSRAKGTLDESGNVSNFKLLTIDAVAMPSAQGAYPESIRESIEMYHRGELLNDLAEAVIYDGAAQKYFKKEIQKFIETMYQ